MAPFLNTYFNKKPVLVTNLSLLTLKTIDEYVSDNNGNYKNI
ncbi:hypothetical protein JCM19301_2186 [Jejuia pallidilutea]|uniref:Uncharacterized protein n=1 Tax=Jejuia pallidilutea TaxID=504487 RepID=A0A090VQQ4_9FLAO|nr:hypothetical protein JCM19301_2186 [Jejuia pallidilutea]GAL70728.1 hypothetical protein JCM19302_2450 [Jejuia pallidilutea]GAL90600.1 hypothetical protein JCM19538_365 [Jejuia pallidilutea]